MSLSDRKDEEPAPRGGVQRPGREGGLEREAAMDGPHCDGPGLRKGGGAVA